LALLPGGHLELYESWQECAKREVKEEMNLELKDVQFAFVTNDPMPKECKHYVTIFMMALCSRPDAVPENMEPNKCEGWQSYSWQELLKKHADSKLFGPLERLVDASPPTILEFLNSSSSSSC
jgi:8-oxo-dGTP diphosphatase